MSIRTLIPAQRRLVVLALAAGLVLTGCGTVRGGEAAKVGDQVITIPEVESYIDDYTRESGQQSRNVDAATTASEFYLNQRIASVQIEKFADKLGVSVTPAEVAQEIKRTRQQARQQGITTSQEFVKQTQLTSGYIDEAFRNVLLQDKITRKVLADKSVNDQQQAAKILSSELDKVVQEEGLQVTVNPRFGKWSGLQLDTDAGALVKVHKPKQDNGGGMPAPNGRPAPQPQSQVP